MKKQKLLLIPAGALGAVLVAASLVYACTTVVGRTEITQIGGTAVTGCNTDTNPPPSQCTANVSTSAGRAIKAKSINGTGTIANKTFYMHFLNKLSDQDSMRICMDKGLFASHRDIRISAAVTSDASGNVPETAGTLPADVHPDSSTNHLPHNGVASVCFVTSNYGYGTQDATILITGGSA